MKVFKFGGASVKDAEGIKQVGQILSSYKDDQLIIVVSAMGKTTNALEQVVDAYTNDRRDIAMQKVAEIKDQLFAEVDKLMSDPQPQKGKSHQIIAQLNDLFVEIEWVLEDEPHDTYDYIYDQIVSIGELCSSRILQAYLQHMGYQVGYMDVRDVLITDDTYRDANINWEATTQRTRDKVTKIQASHTWIVTQGFIASTDDNQTTTLGREGSDFTAAIMSYTLDATSMTIWKDVPGVLTADPTKFNEVDKLDRLSYREAIEMTYYGAKVIHPKTIKPLQNKSIPMYVRSFIDPSGSGTLVSGDDVMNYPPIIVLEENQILIHFATTDFSFVGEQHLSKLFTLFDTYRLKVNMMRNTAISFTICTRYIPDRIEAFIEESSKSFKILTDKNLELITIRHYNDATIEAMKRDRVVLLEERVESTIRMAVKKVQVLQRKDNES